jgi:hypothetical protein
VEVKGKRDLQEALVSPRLFQAYLLDDDALCWRCKLFGLSVQKLCSAAIVLWPQQSPLDSQVDRHIGDKAKRMSEPSITGGPLKIGSFDCRIERGMRLARSDTKKSAVPILSRVNTADWLLE